MSYLKNNGTFRLGGDNGIVYDGSLITIGSSVTVQGGTITGSTITGSRITASSFRANGSNNDTYMKFDGDQLHIRHEDLDTDTRFIYLEELDDVISGTNYWSRIAVWPGRIVFSYTSSGSASIDYEGGGRIGISGDLSVNKSILLGDEGDDGCTIFGHINWGKVTNLNDATDTNFYTFVNGASNTPTSGGGVLLVARYKYSNDNLAVHQIAFMNHTNNGNPAMYARYYNTSNSPKWGSWKSISWS